MHPETHDVVHEVVAPGNRIEQLMDFFRPLRAGAIKFVRHRRPSLAEATRIVSKFAAVGWTKFKIDPEAFRVIKCERPEIFLQRRFTAHLTMNRKKILVVDDDRIILKTLSLKLTAKGYEVLTAMDGSQAVNSVRTQRPDLILLDLTFPVEVGGLGWDGFRIMDWLKRIDEAKDVPVMVITGGDPAKFEAKARAAGASAFFHKPIDSDELLGAIEKAFAASEPPK